MDMLVTACSVDFLTFLRSAWPFSRRPSGPEVPKTVPLQTSPSGPADPKTVPLRKPPPPALPLRRPAPISEEPYGPDWEWSSFEEFDDKGSILTKKIPKTTQEVEKGPFRVIYRRNKSLLWPDVVQVVVTSIPLAQILQRYLPHYGELKSADQPRVDGRQLFAVLDDLKRHGSAGLPNAHDPMILNGGSEPDSGDNARASGGLHGSAISNGDVTSGTDEANGRDGGSSKPTLPGAVGVGQKGGDARKAAAALGEEHLAHLVKFLEREYAGTTARMQRMKAEKRASWDMLWALLPRDSRVVYRCEISDELLYAVVSASYFHQKPSGGSNWFLVELDMWDYDGKTYRKCQIGRQIAKYDGERSFANLSVCPVETFGSQESMEAKFLEKGRTFYDLAVQESNRFMRYTGPIFNKKSRYVWKDHADGRVMIDLDSFAKMNPGSSMGTAAAQTTLSSHRAGPAPNQLQFHESEQTVSKPEDINDQNLIFAPAIVYGFSFRLKRWGAFAVGGFQEVTFDTGSFHDLVMEPDLKLLIHNLVSQYIDNPDHQNDSGRRELNQVDPISTKGEGCVFLCYGPPGSGKTLTAESLAEEMCRPLWAINVSELGTTPNDLEQRLQKVLDIASTWRAVVLLDEADVYLEKRSAGAIMHNALTGVFLRLLEYYKGVLFLTTNRVETFDEAFRSRISVFLSYSKLSTEQNEQVWRTLLRRAGVDGVRAASIADFAARDLNGREIRNVIHTASVWAKSNGETTAEKHVKYVVDITTRSLAKLHTASS